MSDAASSSARAWSGSVPVPGRKSISVSAPSTSRTAVPCAFSGCGWRPRLGDAHTLARLAHESLPDAGAAPGGDDTAASQHIAAGQNAPWPCAAAAAAPARQRVSQSVHAVGGADSECTLMCRVCSTAARSAW